MRLACEASSNISIDKGRRCSSKNVYRSPSFEVINTNLLSLALRANIYT